MTKYLCALLALPLSLLLLSSTGCGCGFDCNNGNNRNNGPALLTLGFSDSLPEDLKQVVIEVDRITLRRSGGDDVVVEQFSPGDPNGPATDSFQVDLLDYQGRNQLLVISELEVDPVSYSEIAITVLDGDVNRSFVQESDDSLKAVTISGSQLSAPGMSLDAGSERYTVEFGLAQSLRYREASDDYLLDNTGIRTEDNATAASLSGRVARELFDTASPCDEKIDPEAGNRVYIYAGQGLATESLADVYTDASSTPVPPDSVAPFAVASMAEDALTGIWQYAFGFLPPGDYTMAFACDTQQDDPVEFDQLSVPLPTGQVYEITLGEAEIAVCDLDTDADCAAL